MPQAQVVIEGIRKESLNYFRIYVASVAEEITEEDLRSVFEVFGELKSCTLAKNPSLLDAKRHK